MDAYCVDSVSVWLLEVELTKKNALKLKLARGRSII
jgi:hypothetical protein